MGQISEITRIVEEGYCVGCGACAAYSRRFQMELTVEGSYRPRCTPASTDLVAASALCPFSSEGQNETEIGKVLYGANSRHHDALGYYKATYAGYVKEKSFREDGSSGGLGSWILVEALRQGIVDTVLHVKAVERATLSDPLFAYVVSRTEAEVCQGGKSKYYPVTLADALAYLTDHDGRFALVGVPCFVKAIRRFAGANPGAGKKIGLVLGLICGHLKTTGFAESLAWQLGVEPAAIQKVDFRHKLNHGSASRYAFKVTPSGGKPDIVSPMTKLLGRDWGMSFFKLEACEYCDDVTAETADVSIGDAWLPEYKKDNNGVNVIITRTSTWDKILTLAASEGRLQLERIPAERVALSQDAGLRHRREGLAFRLWLKDRKKSWRPTKRVQASCSISLLRRSILSMRLILMKESVRSFVTAKRKNNFSLYFKRMKVLAKIYTGLYLVSRALKFLR